MSRSLSWESDGRGRRPARAGRVRPAASSFYTRLLRGRRGRRAGRPDGPRLWFRIEEVLVETGPGTHGGAPVLLHVDDPLAVAERCWDAGFTVRLLDPPFGDATVAVIDPFGQPLHLVGADCDDPRQAANGE
jgi:catechol 2,3-dioxygenase-like lactoylglutathione lyase family enzyme